MGGDLESLKQLVKSGAAVNAPSDLGTPLHCAAGSGHIECVKYLLKQNVDMEIPDENGVTPLMASVACGDTQTMNLLLEAGADPNSGAAGGATAMHIAASMDNVGVISSLVSKGADPNCVDRDNLKPIH